MRSTYHSLTFCLLGPPNVEMMYTYKDLLLETIAETPRTPSKYELCEIRIHLSIPYVYNIQLMTPEGLVYMDQVVEYSTKNKLVVLDNVLFPVPMIFTNECVTPFIKFTRKNHLEIDGPTIHTLTLIVKAMYDE